jgi:hypothetical protein
MERLMHLATDHPVIAGAILVLLVTWLLVSMLRPGALRRRLEWIATTSLYVGFFGFFATLLVGAIARDSLAGMLGFGMLAALFGMGLLVSTTRTLAALVGRGASARSTSTH